MTSGRTMELTVTLWKILALVMVVALVAFDLSSDVLGTGRVTGLSIVALVMIWFPGIYGTIWGLRTGVAGRSSEPIPEGCVTGLGWFLLGLMVVLTLVVVAVR